MTDNKTKKGIFICIDGADGSGKSTQKKLLAEKLKSMGHTVEELHFPQYGEKSAGPAEEYLNGRYGEADDVNPYACSVFYAVDRFAAKTKIEEAISEGKIIISDRYVSGNMGHQGAKIDDKKERQKFFDWLYNLEYEIFGLPRPDINIILNVHPNLSKNLLNSLDKKPYLDKESRDIHEKNAMHLEKAVKVYAEIADNFKDFKLIKCSTEDKIFPVHVIEDKIWNELEHLFIEEEKYSPDFKKIFYQDKSFENILKVEKIFDDAKLPSRGYKNDAGLDIYTIDQRAIAPSQNILLRTGLKISVPKNHAGLIWDKSGLAKNGLSTIGGVIDSGYRGELIINVINIGTQTYFVKRGQKIAQLLIQKIESPIIMETKIEDQTERGESKHGSTGIY